MMHRRTFAAGALALACAPFAARPQQPARTYRLAFYTPTASIAEMVEGRFLYMRGFFTELRRLGFVEGQNLVVLRFTAEGYPDRNESIAREIIAAAPDVIVCQGDAMPRVLLDLTRTIPIVVQGVSNILELLRMPSLARPGRNLTGFSADAGPEMHGKRLQFLKELAPRARRLAYLGPQSGLIADVRTILTAAAATLGVELVTHGMEGPYDEANFRAAFARIAADRVDGIYLGASNPVVVNRHLIVDLVAALGVPAIYVNRQLAEAGGLMSYANSPDELNRGVAEYVVRILDGENPADLPIQLPRRFEFIINLKTARALGLTIPENLLVFATEVIE
jgi:putative tryptophan/tyrosine transport system substrate-binding protein